MVLPVFSLFQCRWERCCFPLPACPGGTVFRLYASLGEPPPSEIKCRTGYQPEHELVRGVDSTSSSTSISTGFGSNSTSGSIALTALPLVGATVALSKSMVPPTSCAAPVGSRSLCLTSTRGLVATTSLLAGYAMTKRGWIAVGSTKYKPLLILAGSASIAGTLVPMRPWSSTMWIRHRRNSRSARPAGLLSPRRLNSASVFWCAQTAIGKSM